GALADPRVLHLHMRTGLGAGTEDGAGAEVGEGADGRTGADLRAYRDGVGDHGALADLGVGQGGAGADLGAGRDGGAAVTLGAGVDHGVGGEGDVDVDPGGLRVDDGDPGAHVALQDAAVEDPARVGELNAVVDPLDLEVVARDEGAHLVAVLAQDGQYVGEVLLALSVVAGDALDRVGEEGAVEGVDAGVHLVDGPLLRGSVALFDDAEHGAVGVADDAAVAGGVGHACGQDSDGVALGRVGVEQTGEGL